MTENIKTVFFYILYLLILGLPLYGLYKLPATLRSIRIKKLAKKYDLKYERIIGLKKFEMLPSGSEKRNRITGIISNFEIEIYDYIGHSSFLKTSEVIKEHHTVLIKNGEKQDIMGVAGYLRIGTIDNWLNSLLVKKELKIKQPHKIFLKYALYALLTLIIILLLVDPDIFIIIFETLFKTTKINISENVWHRFKFILIVSILISGLIKFISNKKSKRSIKNKK